MTALGGRVEFFAEIHRMYMSVLAPYFAHLADDLQKHGGSVDELVDQIFSKPARRDLLIDEAPRVLDFIHGLWQEAGPHYVPEIRKLGGVKAAFGGDVGPQAWEAIYERAGLYYDTLIVPDPMLRTRGIPNLTGEARARLFVRHGINLLMAREAYEADLPVPICVLVPDDELSPEGFRRHKAGSEAMTVLLVNELYDERLETYTGVRQFMHSFGSAREALREMNCTRPIFTSDAGSLNPEAQWDYMLNEVSPGFVNFMQGERESPAVVLALLESRMAGSLAAIERAEVFGAHPLVTAPTAYEWVLWTAEAMRIQLGRRLPEFNGLQFPQTKALLHEELRWLANVDVAELVALRRRGFMSEMRNLVGGHLSRLKNVQLEDIAQAAREADTGLKESLRRHQDEIVELEKSSRLDFGAKGVALVLSLGTMMTPMVGDGFPVLASMAKLLGAGTVMGLFDAAARFHRERRRMRRSPIGILWGASKSDPV